MIKRFLLVFSLFISPLVIFSQEDEDNTKMVREVVNVMVDKSKFAPPPPPTPTADPHAKKGHKKQQQQDPPPVVADTGNPMMPAPSSEIYKRAQNWYKAKAVKFVKANGTNSGSNVSCNATFTYKQKILNPENEVDGEITMDVIIEAKEGKYRYTIKNIKHKATKEGMNGGDIYLAVPECGSMKISDLTWKHIKSAAYADIQIVIDELKARMKEDGDKKKDDW
jgi:hypothetical protein